MVNKNIIIAIILIMVAITLIGLGVVIALKDMTPKDTSEDSIERLYVIEANNAYGVMNSKGKIVAQPQFSKIARINNIIYLKFQHFVNHLSWQACAFWQIYIITVKICFTYLLQNTFAATV